MKETVGIVMMNIMGIIMKIIMKIMMIAANHSIATHEGREKQPDPRRREFAPGIAVNNGFAAGTAA